MNAKDEDGDTALMCAEEKGHTEIVEILKQAGARE
jgi:ankyrin repeat protein